VTPYQERIVEAVRRIPHGRWVTYGDVARSIGNPQGARTTALRMIPMEDADLPSWRVVKARGVLPDCHGTDHHTADEWWAFHMERWREEELLTADETRARPELHVDMETL
jgi:alkylated DNA nucleotide flippase Atl1